MELDTAAPRLDSTFAVSCCVVGCREQASHGGQRGTLEGRQTQ